LELLCSRVPTYTGTARTKAWDWLSKLAESVRERQPALLIGDLNTSLTSKAPMPQFVKLVEIWRRLQPLGTGSYFGQNGLVTEIDHAMVTGMVDATAWYVRGVDDHVLAGGPDALSDHAGLFVQLSLQ
jgi:endonuclease/exonuclease/phosphatase family metal-dependent hydrolase